MTLDEKVDEATEKIMRANVLNIKRVIREILLDQIKETRRSCADEISEMLINTTCL